MIVRSLMFHPDAPSPGGAYDVFVRTDHGDEVRPMLPAELERAIRTGDGGPRLASLRVLAHRFPWSWIPATAADGRTDG